MKKPIGILFSLALLAASTISLQAADAHRYREKQQGEQYIKYIEIDYNKRLKPAVVTANDVMVSTEALKSMAERKGAFAAINGGYFSSYGATKYPYAAGTLIRDGRILTVANNKSVIGFKKDGSVIMDILSFHFEYVLGEYRWCVPWNYNRPNSHENAITIYTSDFGAPIEMPAGSKAVILKDNVVQSIQTSSFSVPKDSVAVHFNVKSTYVVDKIKVGDKLIYKQKIITKYTQPEDWEGVEHAVGSGPLLMLNGYVIPNPIEEGFTDSKITTQSHARSFIGITKDNQIKMGNVDSATIAETAQICKNLGLHHAMCLDGGGSVNLYHNGSSIDVGRNLNNGLVFYMDKSMTGGDMLYKHGFIKGKSASTKRLDEAAKLSREELASIILEINGLLDEARETNLKPDFSDNAEISDWAKPIAAYVYKEKLMMGTDEKLFSPKTQVNGKMLGQIMLRALGYQDITWENVDAKLSELGLKIQNKSLSRGEAFDFIWEAISKNINLN